MKVKVAYKKFIEEIIIIPDEFIPMLDKNYCGTEDPAYLQGKLRDYLDDKYGHDWFDCESHTGHTMAENW